MSIFYLITSFGLMDFSRFVDIGNKQQINKFKVVEIISTLYNTGVNVSDVGDISIDLLILNDELLVS